MTVYITGPRASKAPIKVTGMKVFSKLENIVENKIDSMIEDMQNARSNNRTGYRYTIDALNYKPQIYKCELDSFDKNKRVKDSEWDVAVLKFKDNNPDKVAKFLLEININE